MQSTSPRDSEAGSSVETIAIKFQCPIDTFNPPVAVEGLGHHLNAFSAEVSTTEKLLSTDEAEGLKLELEELERQDDGRIKYLQERLDSLKEWIRSSFGVDDLSNIPEVQSPKGGRGKALAEDQKETSVTSPTTANTGEKKDPMDEIKPVIPLRIKLVDEKSRFNSNSAPRAGTGSKNLSRMMSKPMDNNAEAKSKIANQTPIAIFWNYIEPFFKSIDENDLGFFDDSSRFVDPVTFTIPPLGKHYEEKWNEQYGYVCGTRGNPRRRGQSDGSETTGPHQPLKVAFLRERLLAMMIEENLTVPESEVNGCVVGESTHDGDVSSTIGNESASPQSDLPSASGSSKNNISILEHIEVDERIKQEFARSGLSNFVPKIDYQEDDEICAELRTLQRKLAETVCVNHYRKRKLAELIRSKLAAQEFYTLLGDVDKQIEQSFAKKSKVQKKKKKGSISTSGPISSPTPSLFTQSSEALSFVETRSKLLDAFSSLIPSQSDFLASSKTFIYDQEVEEKVVKYARESGSWLPIPEQPLVRTRLARSTAHPVFPLLGDTRTRQSSISFELPTVI